MDDEWLSELMLEKLFYLSDYNIKSYLSAMNTHQYCMIHENFQKVLTLLTFTYFIKGIPEVLFFNH